MMAASIEQSDQDIAQTLEALDVEVSTLRQNWSGDASEAYDATHAQWLRNFSEMNRILYSASSAAANSTEAYANARSKIHARWQ